MKLKAVNTVGRNMSIVIENPFFFVAVSTLTRTIQRFVSWFVLLCSNMNKLDLSSLTTFAHKYLQYLKYTKNNSHVMKRTKSSPSKSSTPWNSSTSVRSKREKLLPPSAGKERELAVHLESASKLKKVVREHVSHGDIVGHTDFKQNPPSPNSYRSKCAFGNRRNQESPLLKERVHLPRPSGVRTSISDSNNIIVDPPTNQSESNRRKRRAMTPTLLEQSTQQENVTHFSVGGPRKRPSSAPRTLSTDMLHYDPDKYSHKAQEEYTTTTIRRRMSPLRFRNNQLFQQDDSTQQQHQTASTTILLPSTSYTNATNSTIGIRVNRSRPSSITRSSSSSSILAWDTS
jgi:hypothetical protein